MTDAAASQAPRLPLRTILFEIRHFRQHPRLSSYHRGKNGEEEWMCLGGEYGRLPDNYAATLLDEDSLPVVTNPEEEFRHPRIYSPEIEWQGYIPDAIDWYLAHPDEDLIWVYEYYSDLSRYTYVLDDQIKITSRRIKEIADDLKEAREIVCRLEERGGLPLTMVDSGYRAKWLKDCAREETCRCELYKARACLLHLLGAISWGLGHVDEFTKGLVIKTRSVRLHRWLIPHASKLGFVLDPRSEQLENTPFLELLENGCPIYYPWSYRWCPEQSDREILWLGEVSKANFADIVERSCSSKPLLLTCVRTKPPPFPSAVLGSQISSEDDETLDATEDLPPPEVKDETRELILQTLLEKAEGLLGKGFMHARPTHVNWTFRHEDDLPKDSILIISPQTEARMRLWALWLRCANPAEVVLEAIARGMPVKLVYSLDSVSAQRALAEHEPHTPPTPRRALQGTHNWFWDTWDDFLSGVRRLLALPNAVAYVMHGGLIARIAFWLGPLDLLDKFVKGPSTFSALRTTELNAERLYLCDAVEPDDLRTLYGTVQDPTDGTVRSWFPTQENMEYCGFWRGEWTDAHEQWFSARVDDIRERNEHARPLTAHQWSNVLRRRRTRTINEEAPELDRVEQLVEDFAAETGGKWNGSSLQECESRFGY